MKILINSNNVAVFFESSGVITLQDNVCTIGSSVNYQYNASNATLIDVAPPEYLLGNCYKREGDAWVVVDEAAVDLHRSQLREQFNAEQKAKRKAAYAEESDPIFFMAQRGEATTEQWDAKINEITNRYPYYYDEQGNTPEPAETQEQSE